MHSVRYDLSGAEVVSFDVFDTALLRTVLEPTDVFLIAGMRSAALLGELSPERFRDLRREADARCRPRDLRGRRHEANLAEIYTELATLAGISAEVGQALMEMELAVELEFTQANPEVLALYQECVARGQRIVFISDMYLPENALAKMLIEKGFSRFERVFVSCEFRQTKRSGELFPVVMREIGVPAERWVHIGDNVRADVEGARKKGIRAIHYVPPVEVAGGELPHLGRWRSSLAGSLMGALIVNRYYGKKDRSHLEESNFWEHFGYAYVGPVYFGFVSWLVEQIRRDGIQRVHFLAREGYVIQQVYERFEAQRPLGLPRDYLYASRRLYGVASITDLDERALALLVKKDLQSTVGEFLRSNGIDPAQHIEVLRAKGFSGPDERLRPGIDGERARGLLLALKEAVLAFAARERATLADYLKSLGFDQAQRVAVVDVGWNGSMQKALAGLAEPLGLRAELQGYYLGAFPRQVARPGDLRGYLIDQGGPGPRLRALWEGLYLLEFIFAAPHTSIVGLRRQGERIMPMHREEPENPYQARAIASMQQAALAFVDDMLATHGAVSVPASVVFTMLERLLLEPTKLEAQMLGDLSHDESLHGVFETSHIARPTVHTDNPLRFGRLFREFRASHWKMGYLKRSKVNPAYKKALVLVREAPRLKEQIRSALRRQAMGAAA